MYEKKISRRNFIWLLTIVINIVIPKAGMKVQGIPLTVGNILLAMSTVDLLIRKKWKIDFSGVSKFIILSVLFWSVRLLPVVVFGGKALNEIVGQITALIIYPISYYVTKCYLEYEGVYSIEKVIKIGVCAVMMYGIVQFLLGIGAVDIPGLTVNYSDYITNPSAWWLEKYNSFGNSSKIVSTYQNGNVFGCSLILLFPVAFRSEYKREIYRYFLLALFTISIILSGSRSCLIGCIIYIVFLVVKAINKQRIKRNILCLTVVIFLLCIPIMVLWIGNPNNAELINRMFGTSMNVFFQGSGRTNSAMEYFRWISTNMWAIVCGGLGATYSGGAYEMTYIAVFIMGGIIGVTLFLLPFVKVLLLCKNGLRKRNDSLLHGVKEGLTIYLITAFLEGAYWLPPTAINVWMICAMGTYMTGCGQRLSDDSRIRNKCRSMKYGL